MQIPERSLARASVVPAALPSLVVPAALPILVVAAALLLVVAFWLVVLPEDGFQLVRTPADQLGVAPHELRLGLASWILGLPAALLLVWGGSRLFRFEALASRPPLSPKHFALFMWVAALLGLGVVRYLVLGEGPLTDDEWAYHFQARTFAQLDLAVPPPPDLRRFDYTFLTVRDGKWFCYLQPGLALLMAPGVWLLDDPFLSLWPIHAALVPATYLAARRLLGETWDLVSRRAALLVLFAPTYLLMGATVEPYAAFALLLLIVAFAGSLALSGQRTASVSLGAVLGLMLLTRPLEFGVVGLCTGLVFLWSGLRGGARLPLIRGTAFALLGFLPFAGFQLVYNDALMGDPFTLPMTATQSQVFWGFGAHVYKNHDLGGALVLWGGNLFRLSFWLALGPLSVVLIVFAQSRRACPPGVSGPRRLILVFCALLLAALLPYSMAGVADFGPAYLFVLVAPLSVCVALSLGGLRPSPVMAMAISTSTLTILPYVLMQAHLIAINASTPYEAVPDETKPSLVLVRRHQASPTGWVFGIMAPSPALDDRVIFAWATPEDLRPGGLEAIQARLPGLHITTLELH